MSNAKEKTMTKADVRTWCEKRIKGMKNDENDDEDDDDKKVNTQNRMPKKILTRQKVAGHCGQHSSKKKL